MIEFDKCSDDFFEGDVTLAFHNKKCKFFVKDLYEKISTNGNPMLELKIDITNGVDKFSLMDWIVLRGQTIKLKKFMTALGFAKEYELGVFDERKFINRTGKCFTIVEEYEKNGRKGKSVKIDSYLDEQDNKKPESYLNAMHDLNDDIPF